MSEQGAPGSAVNLDVPSEDKFTVTDIPGSQDNLLDADSNVNKDDTVDPSEPLLQNNLSRNHRTTPKTPADKVRVILSPDKGGSSSEDSDLDEGVIGEHGLFCQLDVLCHFDNGELGWKEKARWLKYEEKVEDGDRWSKPHVHTTSLHSLFAIRKAIAEHDAVVDLDVQANHNCIHQVAELLADRLRREKNFSEDQLDKIVDVITRPHKHKHRKADKKKLEAKLEITNETADSNAPKEKKKKFQKKNDLETLNNRDPLYPVGVTPEILKPYKPNKRFMKKIPPGSEVANILVGQVDFLKEQLIILVRLSEASNLGDITEVSLPTKILFIILGPTDSANLWQYEETGRAAASLFSDKVFCEVVYKALNRQDLVDGIDEFIDDLTVLPPSIWDPNIRLEPPAKSIAQNKIRQRLVNSSRLSPNENINLDDAVSGDDSLKRTGKFFGGMYLDMKRRYRYYLSDIKDGFHIQCLASIVFLYFACLTPIVTFGGLMGSATDGMMGTMETILSGAICGIIFALFSGQPLTIVGATGPLLVFESIMYIFCEDYGIDFLSFRFWTGVWITAIIVTIVMFDLSFLVSYITRFTEESFSVLISLIFIMEAFKKVFHVWDIHPVNTKSASEPDDYKCHCVQANSSGIPILHDVVGTVLGPEVSAVTANLTDETPPYYPYAANFTNIVYQDCINFKGQVSISLDCLTEEQCTDHGWLVDGPGCKDHGVTMGSPNVFFLSLFLFLGTYFFAMMFRNFRTSRYFPSKVRNMVADFAVFLSIVICVGIDIGFGIDTPKLMVPTEFRTTRSDRTWVINPGKILPHWYLILLALLPAVLATILIFLDQQITAVIINRKEHKLKKPPGYHLDMLAVGVTIFICSLLGLPWFVAATVRSITHVKSLVKESEIKVPGDKPQMLGIREQRLTGFFIHILIGVSVLMTAVLRLVPMPVLYGVFLYMGITSLNGVQFVDRIKILFMPKKYQPDLAFLRHVDSKKITIFTLIQIVCMVAMWVVKSIKKIAITFPLLVAALCFVRKAMDYWFNQSDLYWLDHILPESDRRKKEDELAAEGIRDDDSEKKPLASWPEESNTHKEEEPVKKKVAARKGPQRRPKI